MVSGRSVATLGTDQPPHQVRRPAHGVRNDEPNRALRVFFALRGKNMAACGNQTRKKANPEQSIFHNILLDLQIAPKT